MIEILYFEGCPNHEGLEARIRALLDAAGIDETITHRRIDTEDQAQAAQFLGSPTIHVNGIDVEPDANHRDGYGLTCRVYDTDDGLRGTPPDRWINDALQANR